MHLYVNMLLIKIKVFKLQLKIAPNKFLFKNFFRENNRNNIFERIFAGLPLKDN